MRKGYLALAILLLVCVPRAHAEIVTMGMTSMLELQCPVPCVGWEPTGLPYGGIFEVKSTWTFDTDQAPTSFAQYHAIYDFERPQGMSITVGAYTYYYDTFTIRMDALNECDRLVAGATRFIGADPFSERGSLFSTSNCRNRDRVLPDFNYTLDALMSHLDGFVGTQTEMVINPPGFPAPQENMWRMQGSIQSVYRVPEPSTFGLIALCGIMGFVCRPRRSSRR